MTISEYQVRNPSSDVESTAEAGVWAVSPFAVSSLHETEPQPLEPELSAELSSPFTEALATLTEDEAEDEALQALVAELEDEEFSGALEALANEAAGRHLSGTAVWSSAAEAPAMAGADVGQWMEAIAAEADRMLASLEEHFRDRSADTITDDEIDDVMRSRGPALEAFTEPLDAQELFFGSLWKKAKKAVRGVTKLVKKGIRAASKFLPLGRLFSLLKKLVRPLLRQVLHRAIGKLPRALRRPAKQLAARFGLEAEADLEQQEESGDEEFGEEPQDEFEALAEEFDTQLAEAILAPDEASAEALATEYETASESEAAGVPDPVSELDAARQRLARELISADPDVPPTQAMEQFIPAVMAARPLIRLGIRMIGRQRVVNTIAKLIARLIQGVVGAQMARLLSRHIASTGLGLLGLEAEAGDGTLGAEALVAATEDTVRRVLSMPAQWLENEALLEAAVQDSFAEATVRHLPAEVIRPDLLEAETEGEHGVWIMMPRATRPVYRYKKYSRAIPVVITRPVARSVVLAEGETLEDQLLDAGVQSWPVHGEVEMYETLPGAEAGHLAAYEAGAGAGADSLAGAALEFSELASAGQLPLPSGRPAPPGRRLYRLRVRGARLRRRSPFSVRLDLGGARPEIRVHLRFSERQAHHVAQLLRQHKQPQVLSLVRRMTGAPLRMVMTARLRRMLGHRGVVLPSGGPARLANQLADATVAAVARQLPASSATLTSAAQDPAPGVTLSFVFAFQSKQAIGRAAPAAPTLTIRPGQHRD